MESIVEICLELFLFAFNNYIHTTSHLPVITLDCALATTFHSCTHVCRIEYIFGVVFFSFNATKKGISVFIFHYAIVNGWSCDKRSSIDTIRVCMRNAHSFARSFTLWVIVRFHIVLCMCLCVHWAAIPAVSRHCPSVCDEVNHSVFHINRIQFSVRYHGFMYLCAN